MYMYPKRMIDRVALKEGMQIKWRKPSLNIQRKKHEILKPLV